MWHRAFLMAPISCARRDLLLADSTNLRSFGGGVTTLKPTVKALSSCRMLRTCFSHSWWSPRQIGGLNGASL